MDFTPVAVEGRVKILSLHLLLLIFVCQQSSCPERFNHPGSCPESENKSETKKTKCRTRFRSQGMILNVFLKNIIFQNRYVEPLYGKIHLKFPF